MRHQEYPSRNSSELHSRNFSKQLKVQNGNKTTTTHRKQQQQPRPQKVKQVGKEKS